MTGEPIFNIAMPRWWDRLAFLWRGLCVGFLLGFLFAGWAPSIETASGTWLTVVLSSVFLLMLPSVPKAWIEQRNRIRAAKAGTLRQSVEQGREKR